jgi:protease I
MAQGTFVILVGPDYEDLEVWYPKLRLEEAGYTVRLAGLGEGEYHGKYGYPCKADGHARDFLDQEIAGVLAPGGWAPDKLRRDRDVLALVQKTNQAGKLVATICHGPWILISAGVVRGRKLTSVVAIRDDVVNAGAIFVDEPVVVDGNLVSARVPKDLPDFARAMLQVLSARR